MAAKEAWSQDQNLKCQICSRRFFTEQYYEKHLLANHSITSNDQTQSTKNVPEPIDKVGINLDEIPDIEDSTMIQPTENRTDKEIVPEPTDDVDINLDNPNLTVTPPRRDHRPDSNLIDNGKCNAIF